MSLLLASAGIVNTVPAVGGGPTNGMIMRFTGDDLDMTTMFTDPGAAIDLTVDWGDGTSDNITTYNQTELAHIYGSLSDYEIVFTVNSGAMPKFALLNISTGFNQFVTGLDIYGDPGFTSMTSSCAYAGLENFNVMTENGMASVTDWDSCFNATGTIDVDMSKADCSNVTTNFRFLMRNRSAGSSLVLPKNPPLGFWQTLHSTVGAIVVTGWNDIDYTIPSATPSSGTGAFRWELVQTTDQSIPTAQYDIALVAIEAGDTRSNVLLNFGSSTYTLGSAAATARADLIARGWTVTDGGGV